MTEPFKGKIPAIAEKEKRGKCIKVPKSEIYVQELTTELIPGAKVIEGAGDTVLVFMDGRKCEFSKELIAQLPNKSVQDYIISVLRHDKINIPPAN